MSKRVSNLIFAVGLLGMFMAGLAVRCHVLSAQPSLGWDEPPFTMESALHYRVVRQLYEGDAIPEIDHSIQYPDGVEPAKIYSLSDEYLIAGVARLIPGWGSLTSRVRWISLVCFCLGIPLLGLWVAAATRSRWSGFIASAFYALMLASVIRSTGQELSRENFALPLMVAHLFFNVLAGRSKSRAGAALLAFCSGALLALALMIWDLIQFYIFLFWFIQIARIIFRRVPLEPASNLVVPVEVLATIGIAMLSPYHRAHGLLLSPVSMLGLGLLMVWIFDQIRPHQAGRGASRSVGLTLLKSAFAFAPLIALFLWGGQYAENYGHFAELLTAKISHLNVKPADPAQLSFDARIMWVPGLNSAGSKTVFTLFPYVMLLTIVFVLLSSRKFFKGRDRPDGLLFIVFMLASSFVAFLLFVRFHVFMVIFVAAAMGYLFAFTEGGGAWKRNLTGALLALFLLGEFNHVVAAPERWGRPMVYYGQMRELIDWVSNNVDGEPVVANFGTSAAILTYAGNPIVLHPKFETPRIRDRVFEYGTIMFKGDEHQLRDWMEEKQSRYLIYGMGEFSEFKPEWQMRYFVDALNPPDHVPARKFEYAPNDMSLFKKVWENGKYRVFRLRTREDEHRAGVLLKRARSEFENGRIRDAHNSAAEALLLDSRRSAAAEILQRTGSLLNNGFGESR